MASPPSARRAPGCSWTSSISAAFCTSSVCSFASSSFGISTSRAATTSWLRVSTRSSATSAVVSDQYTLPPSTMVAPNESRAPRAPETFSFTTSVAETTASVPWNCSICRSLLVRISLRPAAKASCGAPPPTLRNGRTASCRSAAIAAGRGGQ